MLIQATRLKAQYLCIAEYANFYPHILCEKMFPFFFAHNKKL